MYHVKKIWAIYEDIDRQMWVGTQCSRLYYSQRKTDQFIQYWPSEKDEIQGTWVTAIYQDNRGTLWVGTSSQLLFKENHSDQFIPYPLESDHIWDIAEDTHGNIWVGSAQTGQHRIDKDNGVTNFRIAQGLPSDTVTGILSDNGGGLWISTEIGLSHFIPSTVSFKNYDTDMGIAGNNFNRPAHLKTQANKVIFGSTEGLTIFKPAQIFENNIVPPVHITDFQIFNQSVAIGEKESPLQKPIYFTDKITLKHNQSVFSISYAALDHTLPQKKYAYQLDGFNPKWNYVGNRRTATYTNLAPDTIFFW
ncbi:MAG: hypothetical protein ACI9Y1_002825 [Lentisphaeria bacterium]|jgi:hypothetical protein